MRLLLIALHLLLVFINIKQFIYSNCHIYIFKSDERITINYIFFSHQLNKNSSYREFRNSHRTNSLVLFLSFIFFSQRWIQQYPPSNINQNIFTKTNSLGIHSHYLLFLSQ